STQQLRGESLAREEARSQPLLTGAVGVAIAVTVLTLFILLVATVRNLVKITLGSSRALARLPRGRIGRHVAARRSDVPLRALVGDRARRYLPRIPRGDHRPARRLEPPHDGRRDAETIRDRRAGVAVRNADARRSARARRGSRRRLARAAARHRHLDQVL